MDYETAGFPVGVMDITNSFSLSSSHSSRELRRPKMSGWANAPQKMTMADRIERSALLVYLALLFRDAFAGAIRYVVEILNISAVWFFVDLVAIAHVLVFFLYVLFNRKSVFFLAIAVAFIVSSLIGILIWRMDAVTAFASFKMVLPAFVGLSCGRALLGDSGFLRSAHLVCLYASIIGVFAGVVIELPWVGESYNLFGLEREQARQWWAEDEVRQAGFSNVSTSAAFVIMTAYIVLAKRASLIWLVVIGSISFVAIVLTISKTNIFIAAAVFPFIILLRFAPERARIGPLRFAAGLSYLTIALPPIAILLLSGVDLSYISPYLASISDRIDNSWQLPFTEMLKWYPAGLVTGCGVGCFLYTLNYSDYPQYVVPIDNMYLANYVQFGLPFCAFLFFAIPRSLATQDETRLILILSMNLFFLTILGYGSSASTFFMGYMFANGLPALRRSLRVKSEHRRVAAFERTRSDGGPPLNKTS